MKCAFYILALMSFLTGLTTSCTRPTEACFTYSPATITTNTVVEFNASCSENASTYSWNFGDNIPDTLTNSLTITHIFPAAGQYNVTLKAKRKDGMTFGKDKPESTQVITVQ